MKLKDVIDSSFRSPVKRLNPSQSFSLYLSISIALEYGFYSILMCLNCRERNEELEKASPTPKASFKVPHVLGSLNVCKVKGMGECSACRLRRREEETLQALT